MATYKQADATKIIDSVDSTRKITRIADGNRIEIVKEERDSANIRIYSRVERKISVYNPLVDKPQSNFSLMSRPTVLRVTSQDSD